MKKRDLQRALRLGIPIDVRLRGSMRPTVMPNKGYSAAWNEPPIEAKPVAEAAACNTLRDACLDHFDSIVDATGCSFIAAMQRCGCDGAVVL